MSEAPADTSSGRARDDDDRVAALLPERVRRRFEVASYRNAAAILQSSFPEEWRDVLQVLDALDITEEMVRRPGGAKSLIAYHLDDLMPAGWVEARIAADLHVTTYHAKRRSEVIHSYVRPGFLDGHRIDFLRGRVAFDLEWNSKDQTYDRDLDAFSAFYEAGAIDVGIILTRGTSIDNGYLRSLGKVLDKDGQPGSEEVYKKFGASTTWMGKLLYRLDAGRNRGCPVLALGITPAAISRSTHGADA